jgi:hypothetical protein
MFHTFNYAYPGGLKQSRLPLWSLIHPSYHVHLSRLRVSTDGSSTSCDSKCELLDRFTRISVRYFIRVFVIILQTSVNLGLPHFLSELSKFSKTMAHFMSRLKMVMPFVVNIIPNGDLQLAMQLSYLRPVYLFMAWKVWTLPDNQDFSKSLL